MRRKWIIAAGLMLSAAIALALRSTMVAIPSLFRRNAELKTQGYDMSAFEFKMLAAQHQLNHGEFRTAFRTLRRIKREMNDPHQMRRIPEHASAAERMAYLVGGQDSRTGAFMDPTYPLFTYFAPTVNAVNQLKELSLATGHPVKLEHPLRFLKQIEQPEQLKAYLDSLLYLHPWCAHMPGPGPYGPGVSELAYFDELEDAGVHRFSEEWKDTLKQWFQDTQDPVTGFWGARIGTPERWRQRPDINSTYHVLHLLLDQNGDLRSASFPLRHAGNLARSILARIGTPLPQDTAEQHDWGLVQAQGAGALIRLLWPHLSEPEREEVRGAFRRLLAESYRLYRADAGGFAYYATDKGADVDGTSLSLSVIRAAGAVPGTLERERLWGAVLAQQPPVVQQLDVEQWTDVTLPENVSIRSIRIYADRLPVGDAFDDTSLVHIAYPGSSPACDIMDLRQGLTRLLAAKGQSFGNWTSKDSLRSFPLGLEAKIKVVPVTRGTIDWEILGQRHPRAGAFFAVGFDDAQIPVNIMKVVRTKRGS